MALTALKRYDNYTFTHMVNVAALAMAQARALNIEGPLLREFGFAALMHDMGKSKLAPELMNKGEPLTADERVLLRDHTWEGALALLELPAGSGRPWRSVSVAYEHHMRTDLRGYPAPGRTIRQGFFSKLIAVVDVFDNATTGHIPIGSETSPSDILRRMRDDTSMGLDPVIVKAFINLTGIYPAGTLVVLDSMELAVVHGASVEDGSLIGIGAIVLNRAVVGAGSIVGAGALVPEGMVIPPGSLAVGVPATVRPLREAHRERLDAGHHAYLQLKERHRADEFPRHR